MEINFQDWTHRYNATITHVPAGARRVGMARHRHLTLAANNGACHTLNYLIALNDPGHPYTHLASNGRDHTNTHLNRCHAARHDHGHQTTIGNGNGHKLRFLGVSARHHVVHLNYCLNDVHHAKRYDTRNMNDIGTRRTCHNHPTTIRHTNMNFTATLRHPHLASGVDYGDGNSS